MTNYKSPGQRTANAVESKVVDLRPIVHCHKALVAISRGFSLVELLVVVAIMGILAVLLSGVFTNFRNAQTLRIGASSAASVFERARALSVAGANGTMHGVHIASTTLTLFEGPVYVSGDPSNKITRMLNDLTVVGGTQLAGGSLDVIFDQLTGTTAQSGRIVLQAGGGAARQRTLILSRQGIVSVQ